MFERYDEPARRSLFFARYAVTSHGGVTIEPEHVVLGVMRADSALIAATVDPDRLSGLEAELAAAVQVGSRVATGVEIPFASETRKVLQHAAVEADEPDTDRSVTPAHLLLGVFAKSSGTAVSALHAAGVSPDRLREYIAGQPRHRRRERTDSPIGRRRVRYRVFCSLDGYVAGPDGDVGWIAVEPDRDLNPLLQRCDTIVVGHRTIESSSSGGWRRPMMGMRTIVASRTLPEDTSSAVEVRGASLIAELERLRQEQGKEVWLFGGGTLFRSLLAAGQVDVIEVAVMPVLLGGGRPLFGPGAPRTRLTLTASQSYQRTGTMWLEYAVLREEPGPASRIPGGGLDTPPGTR